jgi:hypothetical protein
MKTKSNIAALVVIIVFSFLMLPAYSFAGGAVEPLEEVECPTLEVSTEWIHKEISIDSKGNIIKEFLVTRTVIMADDKGYAISVKKNGKEIIEFYNKKINFFLAEKDGKELERSNPEAPLFDWPLKPGKYWKRFYSYRGPSSPGHIVNVEVMVTGPKTLINADGKEVATMGILSTRYDRGNVKLGQREVYYNPLIKTHQERIDYFSNGGLKSIFVSAKFPND